MRRADCRLTALAEPDLPMLRAWRNAPRVRAGMITRHDIAADEHRAWYRRGLGDPAVVRLVFHIGADPVGFVYSSDVDRRSRRCSLGYYVGREDAPRGAGSAMMFLTLEHLFEMLGLHKVSCEILADNLRSLALVRRFGFAREGRFRDQVVCDGAFADVESHALFEDGWADHKERLGARFFADWDAWCAQTAAVRT